jgi:uncharacterized protein YjbI with pentapeptide repeats
MPGEAKFDQKKVDVNGLTLSEKEELYQELAKTLSKSEESKGPGTEEDFLSFDRLYTNIDEASQNCRKTYFIYIALLSYALLTILTTSDLHLILGQNVNLPVIDTNVPVHFFFTLTPFLAIGLFVYIQLYLIKIDKLIKYSLKKCHDKYGENCPEEPKCKKEEKRFDIHRICNLQKNYLYPWIIIFSRYYEKGLVGALQRMIVKFSLWWFLPTVLMTFNLFVIRKHEPISSYYLLFITLIGTVIVLAFWNYLDKSKYIGKISLCLIGLFYLYFALDFIPAANEGVLGVDTDSHVEMVNPQPIYLTYFSDWANINLEHQILISEPENVLKYETVPLINLKGVHLEGANLASTILIRANLRKSSLQYANLDKAVLDGADLDRANLNFAKLTEANLKNTSLYRAQLRESDLASAELWEANLSHSNLQNADLQDANLQHAELQFSNLRGATFGNADLLEAKLDKADLLFADLRGAKGLKTEQIKKTTNWELGLYSEKLFDDLKLQQNHNDRIKKLDFKNFDLAGANLQSADFRGANFDGAILKETNLQEADLRDVKDLTKEQLDSAINSKLAIYNQDFLKILSLPPDHNERLKKNNFNNYNLQGADLRNADLKEANLRNADLKEAELRDADLREADLRMADLLRAKLTRANLKKSNLSRAILENADLSEAKLKGANLKFTDLKEADLKGADIRQADLKGANFQRADLSEILFSNYVQFADVNTLYQAKLDRNLKYQLENNYPWLFKK